MLKINAFTLTLSILLGLSLSACRKAASDKNEAIEMARNKVIYLSKEINGHVPIDEDRLLTTDVRPSNDGGWHVTLVQRGCTYMVYANPGHEIDVTGASEGCFKRQK